MLNMMGCASLKRRLKTSFLEDTFCTKERWTLLVSELHSLWQVELEMSLIEIQLRIPAQPYLVTMSFNENLNESKAWIATPAGRFGVRGVRLAWFTRHVKPRLKSNGGLMRMGSMLVHMAKNFLVSSSPALEIHLLATIEGIFQTSVTSTMGYKNECHFSKLMWCWWAKQTAVFHSWVYQYYFLFFITVK